MIEASMGSRRNIPLKTGPMFSDRLYLMGFAFAASLQFFSTCFGFYGDPIGVRATISESPSGTLNASVNLGEIPSNQKIEFELLLKNGTPNAIEFSKFTVTCNCLTASAMGNGIPFDGELKIVGTLRTPMESRTASASTVLFLESPLGKRVTIRINYRLAGLLCFADRSALFRTVEGSPSKAFRLPLTVTEPVLPTNIQSSCSPELGKMKTKIIAEENGVFLECILASDAGAVGTITVTDSLTKRSATIQCIVDRESALTVAPSILYFTPSKEKENEYVATSIVSVNKAFLKFDGDDRRSEVPIEIRCEMDPGNVTLEIKRMSVGIYRVQAKVKLSDGLDGQNELAKEALWTVATGTFNLVARSMVRTQ